MVRHVRSFALALILGAVAGCGDALTAPDGLPVESSANRWEHGEPVRPLRLLTRNLYLGGSTARILSASSPAEIPALVAETWASIQANDFNERAQQIAREIAATRPHAVGLQEVGLLRIQSPGDALVGNPVPATDVAYDFLEILLDALAEAQLDYVVASVVQNADVELPMATSPTTFDDVRYTDRGVILVRRNLRTQGSASGNFAARLSFPIAGAIPVTIPRGWNKVEIVHRGRTYHILNAHLETRESSAAVQEAQAAELVGLVAGTSDPTVILGDLNGTPEGDTQTHAIVTGAGFVDAWAASGRRGNGWTCCFEEDLTGDLFKRVDYVFARGPASASPEVHSVLLVGNNPRYSRSPGGLLPSDHLGVYAGIVFRDTTTDDD